MYAYSDINYINKLQVSVCLALLCNVGKEQRTHADNMQTPFLFYLLFQRKALNRKVAWKKR